MLRTRILLVEMPRMLGDIIVELVKSQPDMEVVGRLADRHDLPEVATAQRAEIVLVALGQAELPAACGEWLAHNPQLKILAVTSRGRHLAELRSINGEVSPDGLLSAIRSMSRTATI